MGIFWERGFGRGNRLGRTWEEITICQKCRRFEEFIGTKNINVRDEKEFYVSKAYHIPINAAAPSVSSYFFSGLL